MNKQKQEELDTYQAMLHLYKLSTLIETFMQSMHLRSLVFHTKKFTVTINTKL